MARNAADVLAALDHKNPPVLLLMDMNLPGCEAQGFWQSLLTAPGPPFIVAHAFHEDVLPEDLQGRAARVMKNGDMDSLARAISWCLTQTSRTMTQAD